MLIGEAARAAVELLEQAGFAPDDARRDVSVLARHILDWSLTDWAAGGNKSVSPRFAMRLFELARRRASHEPVAYITGVREFYGRPFRVTRDVLIPRPETELTVEAAVGSRDGTMEPRDGMMEPRVFRPGGTILDVGTGSGCIAITLALEIPDARVVATDSSEAALDVARENARSLGAPNVEFIHAPFWPASLEPFDLIVSNPPYIPDAERITLPPDVIDFEPASALFAGSDGLEVIRELVRRARSGLAPGGRLIFEIGAGQDESIRQLISTSGLELVEIRCDLQNIPRIVVARHP
jgi:release factor glutamine methyltransferase